MLYYWILYFINCVNNCKIIILMFCHPNMRKKTSSLTNWKYYEYNNFPIQAFNYCERLNNSILSNQLISSFQAGAVCQVKGGGGSRQSEVERSGLRELRNQALFVLFIITILENLVLCTITTTTIYHIYPSFSTFSAQIDIIKYIFNRNISIKLWE